MRIAYLTGEYPRATDTFIQREVAALREQGIDVFTFSIRRTGAEHIVGPEQQAEADRTFYILPPNPLKLLLAHLSLVFRSPKRYFQAVKLAWQTHQPGLRGTLYQIFYFLEAGIVAHQINQQQIQHLHNHFPDSSGTVAMLAAELGGFSFSFTMHGPYIFFEPLRWRLDEKLKRALFVCCISYFCRSQGMIFAPMEQWRRMHIVHCGVDPALFDLVCHQQVGKRLLYTGRLAAVKGLPILLESLAILKATYPDVLLTVVGDGPDRVQLEQMTAQLGLSQNVNFVGYQSQTEVRQHMQATDVFVLPSFAEGVPVSLMEALAAGVPVVTTQIAGVSELVENGVSGYLVPPGNAALLAERIATLLADPQLRMQFGTAGRAKIEQEFNIHHEAAWLCQIMTAALAGNVETIRPQTKPEVLLSPV
ncbi:MAG: glycosyltransferase [Leptolyngbya sp. IPPAS B-1204]|nr:glycosyltransferase [Elainella sp. C42_A2020_010]RNJ66542.1 MAG: colanic acid biosynthesis glycosyltransferase WcaL [Leptolyngbya sp. IPPAS B-1204]